MRSTPGSLSELEFDDKTGAQIDDGDIGKSDESEFSPDEANPTDRRVESPPPFRKLPAGVYVSEDSETRLLSCKAICNRAAKEFREACESDDPDSSQLHLFSVVDAITELWKFADLRGRPYQDLVGLLDAALRNRNLSEFNEGQRVTLESAFKKLRRAFIDDEDLEEVGSSFTHARIDVLRPVRPRKDSPSIRIVVGDDE